ncbi:MAG: enoyl-CoA hydratase/isomerase family protein [Proteobacteria bacterium]|nr:enoyl-CoA hydratase/isomerase family protein [Pseudomonadota bacterium]
MLSALNSNLDAGQDAANRVDTSVLTNLELRFDHKVGVLWKYIAQHSTPHFSHAQLDDIRTVQNAVRDGLLLALPNYDAAKLKYLVFGSKVPGIFSLGGDLRLFRDLIARRDRHGLELYSRKATDAIFHHAANTADVMTFSLVQGTAMGGGFEATLAGNVVVAERGARLGFPEVLFGLFPGMGAYTLLRRRVDCATAEKIILGAKNYSAEELHTMGIVDVLCEQGEGEHAVYSYISRQAHRPGVLAFRRALNRARAIDRKELYAIADEWVDTAMNLPHENLKRIDRLVAGQRKLDLVSAAPKVTIKVLNKD